MDPTANTWLVAAFLGGAGGTTSAWLTRHRGSGSPPALLAGRDRRAALVRRRGRAAVAAVTAAATAATIAWMIGSADAPEPWLGVPPVPAALAFFWIGFVTAGWMAAERDKVLLHQAVCRAATAPAAHPDTVQALAHASPDAVYEAVKALMPRRIVH